MRLVAIIVFCWLLLMTIDGIGSLGGRKNETSGFNKTGGIFFRYSFFFFSRNNASSYSSKFINLI